MSAPTADRRATGVFSPRRAQIPERTLRTDRWWQAPLLTNLGLAAFVIYATIRAFWGSAYWVADYHYLTPFYSPCVSTACAPGSSHFGQWVGDLPWFIPMAFISLPFLLAFRLTCYYYRKAYYRSFWLSPPACAVNEPHKSYSGERRFPLIIQNIHRYFFYAAVLVGAILLWEALVSFSDPGLGSLILLINAVLIVAYTVSCHSCRHITAGRLNHFSRHPVRYKVWTWVSKLNAKHQELAWASLFSVMIADLYVRLVAKGIINFPFA